LREREREKSKYCTKEDTLYMHAYLRAELRSFNRAHLGRSAKRTFNISSLSFPSFFLLKCQLEKGGKKRNKANSII
jgi:hypothetical protein